MKVNDLIDVLRLLFIATLAFLVTSPIGLGMFWALSHEGVTLSSVMGIGVYFVGFIYLIFAYQFVKNVSEIVDGGAKEIGESVFFGAFQRNWFKSPLQYGYWRVGLSRMENFHLNPPPNNGMHPTADTLLLKFLQRLGAAGDAGR
jgi:hypothetical protein